MLAGLFFKLTVDHERRRFAGCPMSHPGQVNRPGTPGTQIFSVIYLLL
jgi:hypothetical protein